MDVDSLGENGDLVWEFPPGGVILIPQHILPLNAPGFPNAHHGRSSHQLELRKVIVFLVKAQVLLHQAAAPHHALGQAGAVCGTHPEHMARVHGT